MYIHITLHGLGFRVVFFQGLGLGFGLGLRDIKQSVSTRGNIGPQNTQHLVNDVGGVVVVSVWVAGELLRKIVTSDMFALTYQMYSLSLCTY